MKAAIWTAYGPPVEVIRLREVATPEPKAGEVRIRIEAATVTAGDTEMCALRFPWYFALPIRIYAGWWRPKRITVLGQELAGTIDKVGDRVTQFKPGDEVFVATGIKLGGQAEYTVMQEAPRDGMVAPRPASLTAEQAAAVPFAAFEARYFLAKAAIRSGEKILIIGAGGSIGSYAIQIAKATGAQVTAVDRPAKHAMLKEIGADHVLSAGADSYVPRRDYIGGATAVTANDDQSDAGFDVVFDLVGLSTIARGLRALRRGGRFVTSNPKLRLLPLGLWARLVFGKRIIIGAAKHTPEAIAEVTDLIENGTVKPVIGRTFTLDDIVAAYRYAGSTEKIGNVVVRRG
jgi:NADPH:quinone reductase-like Zn-dependent oxidoreductase